MCTEKEIYKISDGITICTCARFASVKGLDLAVNAAELLKEKGYRFLWYLVGNGPLYHKIEKLINEYGLQDYVVLVGMQKIYIHT